MSIHPAEAQASGARTACKPIGEIIFAAGVLSLGIVGFVAGAGIKTPPSATGIGPREFPFIVSGLLVLLGAAIIVQLLRGRRGAPEEGEDVDPDAKTDWLTVAKLVGFVALHILLIVPAGWPVAAAVLFFGASWTLGSLSWWRNAVIAVVMALVLQFVFAGLLGVSLPAGFLLEGVEIFNG